MVNGVVKINVLVKVGQIKKQLQRILKSLNITHVKMFETMTPQLS